MDRRKFVAAAGLAGATGLLGACGKKTGSQSGCEAQTTTERFEWKMVTSWPRDFPGLGTGASRLAESINKLSNGRLKVKVYGATNWSRLSRFLMLYSKAQQKWATALPIIGKARRRQRNSSQACLLA